MTFLIVHRIQFTTTTLVALLALHSPVAAESVVITDWQPWQDLPDAEKAGIAPYCPGGFVAQPLDPNQEDTQFRFDQATSNGVESRFSGDVKITAKNLNANAEQVDYNQQSNTGDLAGDVTLRTPGAGISSTQATISLENYYALLKNAEFVLHDQDLHGDADRLERQSEQVFTAENVSFTRCAPTSNAWRIKSSKLIIDNETNVATAWNPRLEVLNVPVLYFPYVSFPLNDQARTGLLIPTLGSLYSVPYYLHLAPNYDDTVTLQYGKATGWFARNEFRFLTQNHNGINEVDYQLQPPAADDSDTATTDTPNRWAVSHKQSGQLAGTGYDFNTRWVSDINFNIALNPGATKVVDYQNVYFALNRPIFGFKNSLSWKYAQPVVDSTKTMASLATSFQTSRQNVTLSVLNQQQWEFDADEKPAKIGDYSLIKTPEVALTDKNRTLPLGIQANETVKYSHFQRDLTTEVRDNLSTSELDSATQFDRIHGAVSLSRSFKQDTWYVTPSVEAFASNYQLSNSLDYDLSDTYGAEEFTQLAWRGSVDQGLTLTSQSEQWRHELKPRLYYAYAPLIEQNAPILEGTFDNSFKLFTTSRFSGTDRIADLQRLSTSLTYNLKDQQRTRASFSLQKGVKLTEEEMQKTSDSRFSQLVSTDNWQPEYSDWIASGAWYPTETLSLTSSISYRHDWQQLTAFNTEFSYKPTNYQFATLELAKYNGKLTDSDDTEIDGVYHDIKLGAYLPIRQNIGLIGYGKAQAFTSDDSFTVNTSEVLVWDDFKVNELLVGVDIDSCCWNVRLAMMDISVDEVINQQSLFPVNTDRQYFFEFTLKGIGAGFGTIESILQRLDFGYSGRLFNYR
ncbi:LPS-assembly protein LptD [Reinekea sp. G2M2-21]|uniref:LPS-assembly protein LptD n=1 Tax=Reinekea sp. G2M2-21 TaxID=2788942 RepID=UPI0018ABB22A|nr:LPS assembly protein LptD [Reinekea sp. G2M2-21]